jgi:hypothetical protein
MSMIRFKKYLMESKKMSPLSPAEFMKYEWRIDVFLKKYKNEEPFSMKDGKTLSFHYDPSVAEIMQKKSQTEMRKVLLLGKDGKQYKLSALGKDKDFGGKGAGFSTRDEDRELKSLNDQLDAIRSKDKTGVVKIKVGKETYEVAAAVSTPGTPKSDFHLVNANGESVVWISHKKGRTAKDISQWGGVSRRAEPDIFNHPETQKFAKDVTAKYPNGLPRAMTISRKIKSNKLKSMAMYGNQFGRPLGIQNVSILIQGSVNLKKRGGVYVFDSNNIHLNGESVDRTEFEPVFMAIYKGDRNDLGLKGTRVVISAVGGRKVKEEI